MTVVIGIVILVVVLGLLEEIGILGTSAPRRPGHSAHSRIQTSKPFRKAAPSPPAPRFTSTRSVETDAPVPSGDKLLVAEASGSARADDVAVQSTSREQAVERDVRTATTGLRAELLTERLIYFLAYQSARARLGDDYRSCDTDAGFCATLEGQEHELRQRGLDLEPKATAQLIYRRPDFDAIQMPEDATAVAATKAEVDKLKRSRDIFVNELNKAQGSQLYRTFLEEFVRIGGAKTASSLKRKPNPLEGWIHVNCEGSGHGFYHVGQNEEDHERCSPVPKAKNNLDAYQYRIRDFSERRGISYLVHFTSAVNLGSILQHGLYSVATISEKGLPYRRNDLLRLDGYPQAISLSISHPNDKMFTKYRLENPSDEWVVLVLDPAILWRRGTAFCRHNAADSRIRRERLDNLRQFSSLEAMFQPLTSPHERDENLLLDYDPTDVQAEILAFGQIPPEMIRGVVFGSAPCLGWFDGCLGERPASVHSRRGFFGSRYEARKTGWTYNG